MQQKVITLCLMLITSILTYAAPVDSLTARKAAKAFLEQKSTFDTSVGVKLRMSSAVGADRLVLSPQAQASESEFYVFNRDDENGGFVIIAADDCATPVLGYSDCGVFDYDNMPPHVRKWMDGYTRDIRSAKTNKTPADLTVAGKWNSLLNYTGENAAFRSSTAETAVAPLVNTRWDQSPYYNQSCPGSGTGSNRAVTGCVATAMAQVMKYWNYPTTGTGFHSYNHTTYGTLTANFGATTYDWANMPQELTSLSSSTAKNAVATLMYHCGVGVEMDYGTSAEGGSAAYVISSRSALVHCAEYALKTYFGYKTSLEGLSKRNFSATDWATKLRNELDAGRPMVYAGFGEGGHCFVLDGYDNNNQFHFNWGWSGLYDGYFVLTALNPGTGGTGGGAGSYTEDQQAIFGIEPAETQGGGGSTSFDLRLYSALTISDNPVWFIDAFSITANVANSGGQSFSGSLGAAIFSTNGELIDFLEIKNNVSISSSAHNSYTFSTSGSTKFVPGKYYASIFYKTSEQDWTIVGNGSYSNSKEFTVEYEDDIETGSDFTITGGKLVRGQTATVNVSIWNSGSTTFYGKYRVSLHLLDGSYAQNIQIKEETDGLPANNYYVNGLNFTGQITVSPGTYLMVLSYQESGTSSWYYAGSYEHSNPIYVTVEGEETQPDMYESNDTFETAYTLTLNGTGGGVSANVSTVGSNFHTGADVDYYKIVLPAGYTNTVTPRMHDSYNSGNGEQYEVDALYAYSLDGGATWSQTIDDVIDAPFEVPNGGAVYFKVTHYMAGQSGTYLLEINVANTQVSIGNIDYGKELKLYPNPVRDRLFINFTGVEKLTDVQITDLAGQTVLVASPAQSDSSIDLSHLQTGIYFINLNIDNQIITKKIIKQ